MKDPTGITKDKGKIVTILKWVGVITLSANIWGCKRDCLCSAAFTANFCLTAHGDRSLPERFTYVRESEGKPNTFDTLKIGRFGNCLGQGAGKHRVLVYSQDSLVFKSDWIILDAQDCCFSSKDTTIDLPL